MNNALLLAGRELRAYARSPIGYVMAAVMLAAVGYLARVPGSMAGTATRGMATASNRVQR